MLPTYRQAASPAPSGVEDRIELGTALPDAAILDRLVAKWIEAVSDPYLPAAERLALTPLAFEAYCYAVEGRDKIARETRRREALTWQIEDTGKGVGTLHVLGEESPEVLAFLRFDRQSDDTPDLAGWLRYLRRKIPVEKLMERWPEFRPVAAFPEASRRMHTLVVAATGHGKSEVLKALLHPYAQRRRAGVLLIDPGRTLAVDVARWPELHRDNRIIYVEPELRAGLTVGFNPFDRAHLLDVREKSHLAETIGTAISEMTANLTDNMETLVTNCARVLLDQPDATMEDLGRMVVEPPDPKKSPFGGFIDRRRERLLQAAYHHPDRHVRDFFRFRFGAGSYALNRDFLGNRVDRITGMVDVRNALFGPSTIDLERELDAGKFVVVNLAKYGKRKQRAAIGRLLVTMAAAIGSRRMQREGPYTPLHLVVDEVSAMTSPQMIEVLNEQRKVGVHATFAQQTEGEGFSKEQAMALVGNTRCRLAALDDPRRGAELLAYRGKADELPPLQRGQFWVHWEGVPGVHTVQVRSDLVVRDTEGKLRADVSPDRWLPEAAWQAYVAGLTRPGGYYRRSEVALPDEVEPIPPARNPPVPEAPPRPVPRTAEPPAERAGAAAQTIPERAATSRPQEALRPAAKPAAAASPPINVQSYERTNVQNEARTPEAPANAPPRRGRTASAPILVTTKPEKPAAPSTQSPSEGNDVLKKPELPRGGPSQPPAASTVKRADASGQAGDTSVMPPLRSADLGLKKPLRPGEQPPPQEKASSAASKLVRPKIDTQGPGQDRKLPSINRGHEPD